MWQTLLQQLTNGNIKALARAISLVENEAEGYTSFLASLPLSEGAKVIGITGPPGAGKSTLTDALIKELVAAGKKVAVLCVDPSSPFNLGAVLGDRIRMSDWYTHPQVYIRSLATRGSMGGLHPKIIELTELLKAAQFDYVLIETVGVGQSEIEIAGLADVTVVVLVPEAGDEVQTMKAGLMEIADVFVINKSDREGADAFARNLRLMLAPGFAKGKKTEVIKTVALKHEGITALLEAIENGLEKGLTHQRKVWLLAEKAYQLIEQQKMKGISKENLAKRVSVAMQEPAFNLYKFVEDLGE